MIQAAKEDIPGCVGLARVGINSQDPGSIYSPDCVRESERLLKCDCDNGLDLYSKNTFMTYNIIIDYEDHGVSKSKTLYNVSFQDDYTNTEAIDLIGRLVLGLLIAPVIIFILIFIVIKKVRNGDEKDERP